LRHLFFVGDITGETDSSTGTLLQSIRGGTLRGLRILIQRGNSIAALCAKQCHRATNAAAPTRNNNEPTAIC
jgi:hypothetical protein